MPDGLTLNPSTGTISGTPTSAGTWYFEAMATDATGVFADDGFLSIEIEPIAPKGNPVPFLNQPLVPTAVSPGSAGFTLSVTGTGFVPGATINFNRTPLATTFVDNEHLTAAVPASSVANASTISVTVVNPASGGGSSNVVYFEVGASETTVTFANAPNSPCRLLSLMRSRLPTSMRMASQTWPSLPTSGCISSSEMATAHSRPRLPLR